MPNDLEHRATQLGNQLVQAGNDVLALVEHHAESRRAITALRMSIRRVAEVANRVGDANLTIPDDDAERGWNQLCGDLIGWIEATGDALEHIREATDELVGNPK